MTIKTTKSAANANIHAARERFGPEAFLFNHEALADAGFRFHHDKETHTFAVIPEGRGFDPAPIRDAILAQCELTEADIEEILGDIIGRHNWFRLRFAIS